MKCLSCGYYNRHALSGHACYRCNQILKTRKEIKEWDDLLFDFLIPFCLLLGVFAFASC